MSSSKAWGDNFERMPVGPAPQFRKRLVRATVLLMVLIAVALVAAGISRIVRSWKLTSY